MGDKDAKQRMPRSAGHPSVQNEVTDKYSLRGRVFHKLREDILSGKYKENEELREAAIGDELGVSRTPVREAFRQLELEGLLQIVPNKGAYVTGIMEENIYLSEFHAGKGHAEQLAELDNRFHDILYEASNSKMLEHVLREFHEYVLRVRKKTLSDDARGVQSNAENRQIMEAIKLRDADLAEQLANAHIRKAYQNMVKSGLYEAYEENESGDETRAEQEM